MGAYKFDLGDGEEFLRWDGSNLWVRGNIVIKGGSGIANLIDAGALATLDSIAYSAITGAKPPTNADHTADIVGNLAYYNLVSAALLDNTIIIGGFIKTSLLTANNIRVGTLDSIRLNVGAGTNNDIYFKDSGIRLFDAGSNNLYFSAANSSLTFGFGSNYVMLKSTVDRLYLGNVSRTLVFYSGGTLQLPTLYSAPVGHTGDIAFDDSDRQTKLYTQGVWRHHVTYANW